MRTNLSTILLALALAGGLAACGGSSTGDDNGNGGDGGNGGGDGNGGGGDGGGFDPQCAGLPATLRDFPPDGVDFQNQLGAYDEVWPGYVDRNLGPDKKPVFSSTVMPRDNDIRDATSFAQWYHDVAGVNMTFPYTIQLTAGTGGRYVFESSAFFPLDGMGFGNICCDQQQQEHNFLFTTEIHTTFTYRAGNTFTFRGDDDLWLFINGKLALDLGGLHPEVMGTVDLDAKAAELGITPGQKYSMDIFHAERHTDASNFKVETTIDCFEDPG